MYLRKPQNIHVEVEGRINNVLSLDCLSPKSCPNSLRFEFCLTPYTEDKQLYMIVSI